MENINDIKISVVEDLNNINNDIEEICGAIKSSSLTKSTKNLTDLLKSISNALMESIKEG